jgi:hypothetical protein
VSGPISTRGGMVQKEEISDGVAFAASDMA